MIESSILLKPVFWIIAFAWSVYYGYYAFDIHGLNKSGTGYNPHYKWTQHIFNFFWLPDWVDGLMVPNPSKFVESRASRLASLNSFNDRFCGNYRKYPENVGYI